MKKLIVLICALTVVTACQQKESRYTQQSPEIDAVKKLIADYNAKDYSMEIMADTAKTYFNSKTPMTNAEVMEYHKGNDANYSKRSFLDEDQYYEMVVTDDGETWVNCWLAWQCTIAKTGKVIDIPIHLTYQFENGKIVEGYGYWDPTEVVMELQAIEQMESQAAAEEAMDDAES